MSRPVQELSLDGATATGAGGTLETGGRISHSLFVVTDSDPSTLDVRIEGSMDGENWAPLRKGGSDRGVVSASEFEDAEGDGNYAALAAVHGVAVRYTRARITDYGTAGNVDAWVGASSNSKTSYDYREYGGG